MAMRDARVFECDAPGCSVIRVSNKADQWPFGFSVSVGDTLAGRRMTLNGWACSAAHVSAIAMTFATDLSESKVQKP